MNALKNVKLRWKMLGALTAIVVVMVVANTIIYREAQQNQKVGDEVQATYELMIEARATASVPFKMGAAYRGFMLNGSDMFAKHFTDADAELGERMRRLKERTSSPELRARWEEAEKLLNGWKAEVLLPGMQLRRDVTARRAQFDQVIAWISQNKTGFYFNGIGRAFEDGLTLLRTKKNAESAAAYRRLFAVCVWGTVIGAFVALLFGYALSSNISKRIAKIVRVLEEVASGDLTQRPNDDAQDEVGSMSNSLTLALEKISSAYRGIATNARVLRNSAEELSTVSHQMGGNAEETSSQANVVAAAADQVSKNVQTVATATEEMSATIQEIAKSATDGARVAGTAVKVAETSSQVIAQLGASSAEIGNVIKVITSIAEQTNLLALNATIEAARAGEAGKGFAVVANEVKELAKETARATEEISRKIEAIQTDTQGAVGAIAQITQIIGQVNDIQTTIASAVEEQAATTNEIGRNVVEAAKATTNIAQNISGVAQAAQSTSAGAQQSQTAATELARMAEELNEVVSHFRFGDEGAAALPPPSSGKIEVIQDRRRQPRNGHAGNGHGANGRGAAHAASVPRA
jgi:methyl-accepting chemotaxis protein